MTFDRPAAIPDTYQLWEVVDPFEMLIGPFWFGKPTGSDGWQGAAWPEHKHCNGADMLHGGYMMSFADFALFVTACDALNGGYGVTVAFNSDFIAAGKKDILLECRGEVVRATRSLIFVRGELFQDDATLLTYSGIIKKVRMPD